MDEISETAAMPGYIFEDMTDTVFCYDLLHSWRCRLPPVTQ